MSVKASQKNVRFHKFKILWRTEWAVKMETQNRTAEVIFSLSSNGSFLLRK